MPRGFPLPDVHDDELSPYEQLKVVEHGINRAHRPLPDLKQSQKDEIVRGQGRREMDEYVPKRGTTDTAYRSNQKKAY